MESTPLQQNISKVIVVCGFLGSGKTTLVESILKAPELNKKVAVIQNEFSANMGIESTLMKDADGNDIQDFYEMPNGCICCAAKDDLINTLDAMLEKQHDIEYILVEANGLADSSQLVQTFWLDEGVGSKVQLHQTIAIIDAFNFGKHVDNPEVPKDEDEQNEHPENELLLRQLVHADKILLNKIDLLEQNGKKEESLQHIKKCITHTNKHAQIQETTFAQASLDFLISKNPESQMIYNPDTNKLDHSHKLSHSIIDAIKSVYITIDMTDSVYQKLDQKTLERKVGELIWEGQQALGIQVMRCKGIFTEQSSQKTFMLQGVEDLFEFKEVAKQGDVSKGSFLFVGRGEMTEEIIKKAVFDQ